MKNMKKIFMRVIYFKFFMSDVFCGAAMSS